MKNNKKGLSTIVATLLIILLTLVAVGIIWVVVKNVVQGGSNQVTTDSKCLAADVVATKVTNSTLLDYAVTLNRQGGEDELGGVKLVFTNADGSTNILRDISGNIPALSTVTESVTFTQAESDSLPNPDGVSVVVYFLDASGTPQLCKTATQLKF